MGAKSFLAPGFTNSRWTSHSGIALNWGNQRKTAQKWVFGEDKKLRKAGKIMVKMVDQKSRDVPKGLPKDLSSLPSGLSCLLFIALVCDAILYLIFPKMGKS